MLPCMACTISAAVGLGFLRSRDVPLMIIPGVQYPHWKAPTSRNASCNGWRRPSRSKPSMVVIRLPAAFDTGVMHDRTGSPSSRTVQAPHWPSPHPYLVPVRSRSSRSTLNRLLSEEAFTRCVIPFTSSSVMLGMFTLSVIQRKGTRAVGDNQWRLRNYRRIRPDPEQSVVRDLVHPHLLR